MTLSALVLCMLWAGGLALQVTHLHMSCPLGLRFALTVCPKSAYWVPKDCLLRTHIRYGTLMQQQLAVRCYADRIIQMARSYW